MERPLAFYAQQFLRIVRKQDSNRRAHEEGVLGSSLSFDFRSCCAPGIWKLAVPAIEAGGGTALIRTSEVEPRESGLNQRLVVIEFESVARAVATYQSDAYQAALQALGSAAERDFRIVEGV